MRLPVDRAVLVLNLLVEGSSIRAAERITGHHRDTIMRLLVLVGGRCERFLAELVQDVPVRDVQADEIWGFVGMKERTKAGRGIDDAKVGDAYTFVGIERDTKLVLAWHLGRRTAPHTDAFVEKLDRATVGRFQLTTDGFNAYPEAVSYHLGTRTDFATLVKEFGYDLEEQRRYSPPRIIGSERTVVHGDPDPRRICTSHVECQNLTMRMQIRRLTRLTNAFSRKWENLRAALGLHFAHYNLVRFHRSLRMTPAMKADVVTRPWSMLDLVTATAA
jgi:IS1 family transposase